MRFSQRRKTVHHRGSPLSHKGRALKDLPRRPNEGVLHIFRRQLRNGLPRLGIHRLEFAEGHRAVLTAQKGDETPVPLDLHAPLHG